MLTPVQENSQCNDLIPLYESKITVYLVPKNLPVGAAASN